MKKNLPWILLSLGVLYVLSGLRPMPKPGGFELSEFGRLPVLSNGRVQPLDSVARNSLLQIRTRQTVYVPGRGSMPATEWLLEVFTQPDKADGQKIFRIDNGEVLSLLKLSENEKYFSFNELEPQLDEIERQAAQINKIENAQRTAFQRAMWRLFNALALYQRLKWSVMPEGTTNYLADLQEFQQLLPGGIAAFHARREGKEFDQKALERLMQLAQRYERMSRNAYPLIIPPLDPQQNREDWANIGVSLMRSLSSQQLHPAILAYGRITTAWQKGDPAEFNQAVRDYREWLISHDLTKEVRKARWEFMYQAFQGFYHALVLYVGALLLSLGGLVAMGTLPSWSETLRKSSYWLIVLGGSVHTLCLVYRMALEGRPPVTNLYSSAIFIGWAAVVLGLLLERFYRLGIGNLAASCTGFGTLIIAHNLSLSGDTMEMMRAVLDSNFWLATHVVTITLGYSAMFVAGLLATLYVFLRWTGRLQQSLPGSVGTTPIGQALSRMVYGVLCFATLFSFVGTVLGGIWADQSWGRFWGWDPKENGALLIVLWCAVYLHARWSKLWSEHALMNVAIFGNVVTAWSWFGVNMLGVGLHSYGFMDKASLALFAYAAFNVGLMVWNAMMKDEPLSACKPEINVAKASPAPSDAKA
ncbi:MAG: cytochrome c biogenesis protein CcsA [Verrucomicrobiae bacterium]|nr:cytochrome c biogenesis protein CcsA [Verrucomicrobiae bacterium]